MSRYAELLEELRTPTRELRGAAPETWKAFGALHAAAVGDGALSGTTKELMALAISVAKRCEGCIAHHAKAAARLGATSNEVAEAIGVAMLMGGGPATVYGPMAWDAFCEFETAMRSIGPVGSGGVTAARRRLPPVD